MKSLEVHNKGLVSDTTILKIGVRLILFLLICYIFAHLDRVNVGFAKATMSEDLGFTNTMYGFGAGLFFISYMLFGVPSNYLLDKLGASKWMAIMMIAWGIISTATMFVQTAYQFYLLRFLLGVAEAGFFPGMLMYINRWFPARKRGQVTAIFTLAVPLASVIGAPISGWIIDHFHNMSGMHGWQWMFLLEGAPIILLGFLILVYLPDHYHNVAWLDQDEKQALDREIIAADSHKQTTSFKEFLTDKRLIQLFVIYFAVMLGINAINFWMPTLIHSTGIESNTDIGILTAVPWACACVFMVFWGRNSDKHNERRWHLFITLIMVAVGFTGAGLIPNNTWIVMVMLCIATMGAATGLPMFWQLPPAFLNDKAAIGGIALISSLGNLAGFLAPYLIGWVKDLTASPSLGLYILALIILVGGLITMLIPSKALKH